MRRDFSFPVLSLCFLLSGFAALVYQTAWTREFAFVFGTSELAIATVLAAYMAGLAAGAALAGRLAPLIRRPVLAYGLLELGVALSALAVPLLIRAATRLLLATFGEQPGLPDADSGAISGFYLATSFSILMLPTLFMGATLPLLARHAVRSDAELGPRIAWLYAINTAGAVAGTLVSAFLLLDALGLRGTVWVAVGLNVAVFAIAALLARIAPLTHAPARASETPAGESWILPLIALSGVVSFSYEVLWTRLLAHRLGASVYAFATMLGSFLLGIALGSALASRLARDASRAATGFAFAQLGIAALSLAAFAAADRLPLALADTVALGPNAAAAFALLLPAALCIGATYPLAVRIHAGGAGEAGSASARVYAWNTLGSIAGALGAAHWALPALGFSGLVKACVATSLALAFASALRARPQRRAPAAAAALGCIALAFAPPSEPHHLLHATPLAPEVVLRPVEFAAVGEGASVLVTRESAGRYRMRTNGLPESLIVASVADFDQGGSARWLGGLPAIVRPEVERVALVGLGGGLTIEGIPRSVTEIHAIELEPEVVRANRALAPLRAIDPLADPRVRVHENDARSALLLTALRFDAIVAQASHPWTAGASHLYTREFFELVRARLAPRGVFVQWMGPSFVDEALLRSILATLRAVWPHVRMYDVYGALLFVASDAPFASAERSVPSLLAQDPETLARLGVLSPAHADAWLRLDEADVSALAAGAPAITDDRNLLQMRSPAVAMRRTSLRTKPSEELARLARDGLSQAQLAQRAIRFVEQGMPARAGEAIAALEGSDDRTALRAELALQRGRLRLARRLLAEVLERNPSHARARALAQRLGRRYGTPPALAAALAVASPGPHEAAVAQGHAAADAGDFTALRALEPALAAVAAGEPFWREAAELRATWRVRADDDTVREEASTLLTGLLMTTSAPTEARLLLAELHADADADAVRRAVPLLRIANDRLTPPLTPTEAERLAALARALPAERAELMGARDRIAAFLERAPRVSGP